jgi:hypothetical protein
MQVDLVDLAERPAAGDRRARPVGFPASLVGDLVAGPEQLQDLVVSSVLRASWNATKSGRS